MAAHSCAIVCCALIIFAVGLLGTYSGLLAKPLETTLLLAVRRMP